MTNYSVIDIKTRDEILNRYTVQGGSVAMQRVRSALEQQLRRVSTAEEAIRSAASSIEIRLNSTIVRLDERGHDPVGTYMGLNELGELQGLGAALDNAVGRYTEAVQGLKVILYATGIDPDTFAN